jgi:hypothetical protein
LIISGPIKEEQAAENAPDPVNCRCAASLGFISGLAHLVVSFGARKTVGIEQPWIPQKSNELALKPTREIYAS